MVIYFITQLECQKMCSYLVEIESKVEAEWIAKTFLDKGKSFVCECVQRIFLVHTCIASISCYNIHVSSFFLKVKTIRTLITFLTIASVPIFLGVGGVLYECCLTGNITQNTFQ